MISPFAIAPFTVQSSAPQPPSNLTATALSSSQISLAWQDNSTDEDGFKIERKTGGGAFTEIATVGVNVTAFQDTGLAAGTTFTYRVRAFNAASNSGFSNDASATTQATIPDVRGAYSGSFSTTQTGCTNPFNNVTFVGTLALNVFSQIRSSFFANVTTRSGTVIDTGSLDGTVTTTGQLSGTATLDVFDSGVLVARVEITMNGALTGNTFSGSHSGRFVSGETCSLSGSFTATR